MIAPGAGNDTITAGGGDDTILYSAGNDTILGDRENLGFDTLDLSAYTADEVSFRIPNHSDILIETPDGTVELKHQINRPLGHERSNIEAILFADGSLDEAGIRARAIADQSTAGDDTIRGTNADDVIAGGGGNDILLGGAGADVFEFALGTGQDTIEDFDPTLDLIRFADITDSDVTVGQFSGDAVISFGVDDEIRLIGIDQSELSDSVFEFV